MIENLGRQYSAKYWIAKTRGFDFSEEDKVDAVAYNRVLWQGLMGGKPYPSVRSVVDKDDQPTKKNPRVAVPVRDKDG